MIESVVRPVPAIQPQSFREFLNVVKAFCDRQCNKWRHDPSDPFWNVTGGVAYVTFDSGHAYEIMYVAADRKWNVYYKCSIDRRMTDILNGAKRDDKGNLHLPEARHG